MQPTHKFSSKLHYTTKPKDRNMNPIGLSFFLLLSLAPVSVVKSQERAPHGLAYENPEAFPPSAYNFFHPNAKRPESKDPCAASKCSPLPLAAQVEANQIHESKVSTSEKGGKQLGPGAMYGIIFGVAFVVFLGMIVHHVRVTRRNNIIKANNSVQPYV